MDAIGALAGGNYDNFTNAIQAVTFHGTANDPIENIELGRLKAQLRSAHIVPNISNSTFHRFDQMPSLRDAVSKVRQGTKRNSKRVITRREGQKIVDQASAKIILEATDDIHAVNWISGKFLAPVAPFQGRRHISLKTSKVVFFDQNIRKKSAIVIDALQDGVALKERINARAERSATTGNWRNFAPNIPASQNVDMLVEKLDKCAEENEQAGENNKLAKCIAEKAASTVLQICMAKSANLVTCTLGAMRQQEVIYEEILITALGENTLQAEQNGHYPEGNDQSLADILDLVRAEYAKSGAETATNAAQLTFVNQHIKRSRVNPGKMDSVKDMLKAMPRSIWHLRHSMDEMKKGEALQKLLKGRYLDDPLSLNKVTYIEAKKNLSEDKLSHLSKHASYQQLKKIVTILIAKSHDNKLA